MNIGAGKDSEDRVGDYVSGIGRMSAVADYLTINISSPNTPGLRDLQAPEALAALLARMQVARSAVEKRPPLLVKLAPDIADSDLPDIVRVIQAHGVDGIVVSNTTLSRDGLKDRGFAAEAGGLSGRPLFTRATRMLAQVYKLTEGKQPLIGVGGIDGDDAAVAKIKAGASLLQLYTGLVFEGPKLIGDIKQALLKAMQEAKSESLARSSAATPRIGPTAVPQADLPTTIYHNPRCSKSRQTLALLEERGIAPRVVDYLKTPPSAAELKTILKNSGFTRAISYARASRFMPNLA